MLKRRKKKIGLSILFKKVINSKKGIINDICPKCKRKGTEGAPKFERIRRIMGYKEDFPCHCDFAKEAVTEYYDKLEKSEEKLKKAENDMKELH